MMNTKNDALGKVRMMNVLTSYEYALLQSAKGIEVPAVTKRRCWDTKTKT